MSDTQEWLSLILRWIHVIAGIMWIGQTYLFNWMERAFEAPNPPKKNISGELWMVHGGGFYLVEKQKWPEIMPRTLHWFKWEAMITWLSGFFLLAVTYWMGAPLLPFGSGLGQWQGAGISAGALIGGYAGYRLIWKVMGQNELPGAVVCWAAIMATAWGLSHVFSDRSVYLHVGAIFGTIMVCNVWMTIIPNQRKIMAITESGGQPDHSLSAAAKRCSKHNTFMSVPLLFTMISNHYPMTFGGPWALPVLGVLIVLGFVTAKLIRDYL
jgi:uncharacterized membrane protein